MKVAIIECLAKGPCSIEPHHCQSSCTLANGCHTRHWLKELEHWLKTGTSREENIVPESVGSVSDCSVPGDCQGTVHFSTRAQ